MAFCTKCGTSAETHDKFCSKCGEQINTASTSKSFQQFKKAKEQARSEFFVPKKKNAVLSKANNKVNNTVKINVGIIEGEDGRLARKRGSRLPVMVEEHFNSKEVLNAALKKLSDNDQFFCPHDDYTLLYPDGKSVHLVPGTEKPFTIRSYKQELGKPYSKIDLFVCLSADLEQSTEHKEEATTDFSMDDEESKEYENEAAQVNQPKQLSKEEKTEDKTTIDLTGGTEEGSTNLLFSELTNSPSDNSVRLSTCPVCSKQFSVLSIDTHVNSCLERSNPLAGLIMAEDSDMNDEHNDNIDETNYFSQNDKSIVINSCEEIKTQIQQVIASKFFFTDNESFISLRVRRGHEFEDFNNFFKKEWNKIKIGKVIKIHYIGEPGGDTGGVSREFYSECFKQVKQRYFCCNDQNGFYPAVGLVSVADGSMEAIGHLFVASLVHNGPGPGFLAPWVYDYISKGIDHIKLPKESSDPLYAEVYNANTDEEIRTLLQTDKGFDLMESIGFKGNPNSVTIDSKELILRSTFLKCNLETLNLVSKISSGMAHYNGLNVVKDHSDLFRHVFTESDVFDWKYEVFEGMLSPIYSNEDGSNRKLKEIDTYKYFLDFLEASFNEENHVVPSKILLRYLTGCDTMPPLGLPPKFTIYFKHDCKPSQNGTKCCCLPVVSTCALHATLPVHLNSESTITAAFDKAVKDGQGFHLI